MCQLLGVCVVAIVGTIFPAAPAAAESIVSPILPCARTTIAARKLPVGPAQYQSGSLTLANGASMRLQGTPVEMYRARAMAVGDAVAACYGPLKNYADAGPSRTITVLDLKNGEYYAALIGSWKQR